MKEGFHSQCTVCMSHTRSSVCLKSFSDFVNITIIKTYINVIKSLNIIEVTVGVGHTKNMPKNPTSNFVLSFTII